MIPALETDKRGAFWVAFDWKKRLEKNEKPLDKVFYDRYNRVQKQ